MCDHPTWAIIRYDPTDSDLVTGHRRKIAARPFKVEVKGISDRDEADRECSRLIAITGVHHEVVSDWGDAECTSNKPSSLSYIYYTKRRNGVTLRCGKCSGEWVISDFNSDIQYFCPHCGKKGTLVSTTRQQEGVPQ